MESGGEIPLRDRYIEAVFGEGGYLAGAFPGYAPRAGQIALARAVDATIVGRKHALAEAMTGIGKSVAYAVPASYYAHETGATVVICTSGITLQEQLVNKDLPMLQSILPWPFTFSLLKGRSNLLCVDKLYDLKARKVTHSLDGSLSPDEQKQYDALYAWADASFADFDNESGDVSEIRDEHGEPFEPSPRVWKQFSVSGDDCKRGRCKFKNECFPNRAIQRARESNIIVTNYHMLMVHLALYLDTREDLILPPFDVLIMDECFPAGTRIGSKRIEEIRVGETVPSYDEQTGCLVRRRISQRFVSRPTGLLRITAGHRTVVCTPGHPFMTKGGWKAAISINVGDCVLSTDDAPSPILRSVQQNSLTRLRADVRLPQSRSRILLTGPQSSLEEASLGSGLTSQTHDDNNAMCCMPETGYRDRGRDVRSSQEWSSVLLPRAHAAKEERASKSDSYAEMGSRGQFETHEAQEPDAALVSSQEDVGVTSSHRPSSACSWRERKRTNNSTEGTSQKTWLGHGNCSVDRKAGTRQAISLQDRYCEPGQEDRDRGGRQFTPDVVQAGGGHSQGQMASWSRVDSVEVLEPGSDGTFGGVCPDGLVYNFEVEGTHTYVADGFVVHNCHKLPDICRDTMGFKVTQETIRRVAKTVSQDAPRLASELEEGAMWLFRSLGGLYDDKKRYKARLKGQLEPHEQRSWLALEASLVRAHEMLQNNLAQIKPDDEFEALPMDERTNALIHEAERALDRCHKVQRNLTLAMQAEPGPYVYFLEQDEKKRLTVCSKLVRSADALGALFEKTIKKKSRHPSAVGLPPGVGTVVTEDVPVAIVCTSATLSPFGFMLGELGAPASTPTLEVESPFNWDQQALLIMPDSMPAPNDPGYRDAVGRHFERIVMLAGGRTLGLFTSRRVMEHTYDIIYPACRKNGYRLLKQGEMPRTALIRAFKEDVTSVLLGLESFWAGVDVPGEACSVVVIDRLPFPTPDDPIMDAMTELDDKAFWKYAIPRSIVAYKQGVGRLIRSMSDRGVIVCLDNRLVDKHYGKQFLRALPNMPKTRRLEAICEFLMPQTQAPPAGAPAVRLDEMAELAWDAV